MRPGISWGWSGSAPIYFLVAAWCNSWDLRLVRLVLGRHFDPCKALANIFFLGNPYRAVHLESWFCNLPVSGWSAYSKNTNFGSFSSPCFFVLSHFSVFSKGNVIVAVDFFCVFQSVKLFIHFLSYLVTERGPSNRWPPVWRTRIVCFKSDLLLSIQMYNMSLFHKYN